MRSTAIRADFVIVLALLACACASDDDKTRPVASGGSAGEVANSAGATSTSTAGTTSTSTAGRPGQIDAVAGAGGATTAGSAGALGVAGCRPVDCSSVSRNPPELTFELSYCQGDMCRTATSRADCESRDVVIACGKIASGSDGIPDCSWSSTSTSGMQCVTNK